MTSEIELYSKIEHPVDAITKLGDIFARSGMFGCEKAEQGQVLAMQCLSERISPLDLARKYHVIQGKLSMRSDAMLAEFRARKGKVKWIKSDDKEATAEFDFEGQIITLSFTAADATKAGLLPAKPGSGWAKFPDAMLRARLTSKAMRMLCPEAVVGLYTPEEVGDMMPERPTLPSTTGATAKPKARVVSAEVIPDKSPMPKDTAAEDLAKAMGDAQDEEAMTEPQRKKLFAMLKECGMDGKEPAMTFINATLSTRFSSTKEITKAQAITLLDALEAKAKELSEKAQAENSTGGDA